jgi:hypothetical protein
MWTFPVASRPASCCARFTSARMRFVEKRLASSSRRRMSPFTRPSLRMTQASRSVIGMIRLRPLFGESTDVVDPLLRPLLHRLLGEVDGGEVELVDAVLAEHRDDPVLEGPDALVLGARLEALVLHCGGGRWPGTRRGSEPSPPSSPPASPPPLRGRGGTARSPTRALSPRSASRGVEPASSPGTASRTASGSGCLVPSLEPTYRGLLRATYADVRRIRHPPGVAPSAASAVTIPAPTAFAPQHASANPSACCGSETVTQLGGEAVGNVLAELVRIDSTCH